MYEKGCKGLGYGGRGVDICCKCEGVGSGGREDSLVER